MNGYRENWKSRGVWNREKRYEDIALRRPLAIHEKLLFELRSVDAPLPFGIEEYKSFYSFGLFFDCLRLAIAFDAIANSLCRCDAIGFEYLESTFEIEYFPRGLEFKVIVRVQLGYDRLSCRPILGSQCLGIGMVLAARNN